MTLNRQLLSAALVLLIAFTGCASSPATNQTQVPDTTNSSATPLTQQDVRNLVRNETGPLETKVAEQQDRIQALESHIERLTARAENLSDRIHTLENELANESQTQEDTKPGFTHIAKNTSYNVTLWLDEAYPRSGGCYEQVGEECWNVELNITNNRSDELDISKRYWEAGLNDTDMRKDATLSTGDEILPPNTTKRLVLSVPVPSEKVITDLYFEFQTVDGIKTVHVPVP